MRSHPEIGHAILSKSKAPLFQLAAEIALRHHEKWDGSGYPSGLSGEAIPEAARIVAVADVFDALSMRRPYKDPWPIDAIVAYLRAQSGLHFDPSIIATFIDTLPALMAVLAQWEEPCRPA